MFVGGRQIGKYPEPPIYDGLNHHLYQYLDGLESRYIYIYICIHTYIYIYDMYIYIYIKDIYDTHTYIYISYIYVYVSYVYILNIYIYMYVTLSYQKPSIYGAITISHPQPRASLEAIHSSHSGPRSPADMGMDFY